VTSSSRPRSRSRPFSTPKAFPSVSSEGFAAQRHAEPRVTRDVDVSIPTGLGNERRVIDVMLAAFAPRRDDARAFAERYRVLLLKTADDIGIDATLTALPFEADIIARSSLFEFAPGVRLRTCSAEDFLVMNVCRAADRLAGRRDGLAPLPPGESRSGRGQGAGGSAVGGKGRRRGHA
jgi:hypothetical protein